MNPFHESLEDTFRARKVRAVAEDGVAYTGWVEDFDRQYRHFLLYDAEREDGTSLDAVVVPHADRAELLEHDITIERIPIDDLQPSPYATKDFDPEENREYIRDIREHRGRRSFPLVRPVGDGFEVIDGNKALWVCQEAGVDSQPCQVVDYSDWEATQQFVDDHFPTPEEIDEDTDHDDGWYHGETAAESIRRLYRDWGDRIHSLTPIPYNLERLDISLNSEQQEAEIET